MTTDEESWVGRVLDVRYSVERVLGQGGMGIVLAVRDTGHDELFALKLLVGERAGRLAAEQRFRREAEITRRIRSPYVAEVHHVGRLVTGELYILMEYLDGKDLGQVLERRGALPFQEALQYVIQACAGLSIAHALGVVHRDIKPSNLFLAQRPNQPPTIKLIDFGISKAGEGELELTRTNAFLGSPLYMSPEQLTAAKRVDARSDLFSLGAVFYQLLTGVAPFAADNVTEIGHRILHATPEPPTRLRPELPYQIDAVITKCLAKLPDARFQNATELSNALEALRHPAEVALELYLDPGEGEEATTSERMPTCSFTSDGAKSADGSTQKVLDRQRAILARGYTGMPPAASPRQPARTPALPVPEPEPPMVIPFGVPIPENSSFVGRDRELAALHEALFAASSHGYTSAVVVGIAGPAGIGKTELAAAYARRHRDSYPGGVFWFDGIADIDAQIERHIGAPNPGAHRRPDSFEDSTSPLSRVVRGRPRSLLIIETTVEREYTVRRWFDMNLPRLGRREEITRHHIIHVARLPQWRTHRTHWLGPLDEANAAEVLLRSAGLLEPSSEIRAAAEAVTRAFEGMPAPAHVAGRVLAARFTGDGRGSLAALAGRMPAEGSVARPHELALRALLAFVVEGLSPNARDLLRAAAGFAEEPLSLRAFGRLLDMPVGDMAQVLAELDRYGLVSPRSTPEATSLRPGIAGNAARVVLGVEPVWVAECLGRVTTWLSKMPMLYREIEERGVAAGVAEVRRLAQVGAAATPRFLAELSQTLETEAPRLVDKPDTDRFGRPLGQTTQATKGALAPYPRFLAQVRDAAHELGCGAVLERVEAALREANVPWLRRRTYQQQAKPKVLGIHDATVTAVAVSDDGRRAVSGAADGSLYAYDVETRRLLAELRGRSAPLRRLAISADGKIALSAAEDGAFEVWDLDELRLWCMLEGHSAPVYALAISADGRRAVSAAEDGFICAWDTRSGRPLRSLSPHAGLAGWPMSVAALAFSEDGLVRVASPRGTIWLFDVDSGAVVRSIGLHESPLGFSRTPSRTLVHAKGPFGGLRFRDVESGAVVCEVGATPVMDPAPVAAGGTHCVVAQKDAVARVYSLETGELRRKLLRHRPEGTPYLHQYYGTTGHTGRVTAVAASLDGRTVVTGGADNMVLAWDVEHGPVARYDQRQGPAAPSEEELSFVHMTPDGALAMTTSGKEIIVWDVKTGEPTRTLRLPDGAKRPYDFFTAAGGIMCAVAEGEVHVLDVARGALVRTFEVPSGHGPPVSISEDGRRALVLRKEGPRATCLFWDLEAAQVVRIDRDSGKGWVTFVDPDHVLVRRGAALELVDFSTGAVVQQLDGSVEPTARVVAVCSGRRVWFGSRQGGAVLVDMNRGSIARSISKATHPLRGNVVAASPNGRFVATLGTHLQVWNAESVRLEAELLLPFRVHDRWHCAAMTPDGRTIILASIGRGDLEKYPIPPPQAVGTIEIDVFLLSRVHFIHLEA
ncbi:protein kinase domain-containing protein [Polyangium jinanense]|uniref:non-specific serine/threonine protein kinase n=1 Tax=Polyangium jinanense TaxID=2829994 RepID=A0A9X3XD91_9BACT|nr:protein kinase [Polyangium jinanense]MDC3986538.1 protein kinase [Polyangium jinanense]